MNGERRALALDAAAILAGVLVLTVPIAPALLESGYADGLFARLNATLVPLSNAVPFALGDAAVALALAGLAGAWIAGLRNARGRRLRAAALLALHTLAFAAVCAGAFDVLWGWNYRRAPVAARVAYDPARVDAASVAAFADRIAGILNRDAAAAHARAAAPPEEIRAQLARDFEPVVRRLGDTWTVALTVPKVSLAGRVYEMAGVGGQYDPWFFETLLDGSFLPFEAPRALAHEWAHVAGFGDEGDANLIATIACLRSPDPLIRYSGAYWTFGELPESERRRVRLNPAVVADFQAGDARFRRYYQPNLFKISWNVYDRYLKANGVAGGVVSYSRFISLLVGVPYDAAGLPLRRKT